MIFKVFFGLVIGRLGRIKKGGATSGGNALKME
jgi:hypothetical protein